VYLIYKKYLNSYIRKKHNTAQIVPENDALTAVQIADSVLSSSGMVF
jgi:hypothetical protein